MRRHWLCYQDVTARPRIIAAWRRPPCVCRVCPRLL